MSCTKFSTVLLGKRHSDPAEITLVPTIVQIDSCFRNPFHGTSSLRSDWYHSGYHVLNGGLIVIRVFGGLVQIL